MKTEGELKQIALDIVQGKIFTDRHISKGEYDHMLTTIFMPLGFMAHPENLMKVNEFMKACNLDLVAPFPPEQIAAFVASEPAVIFEYFDKAGPRSINGYPMFMSFQSVNKEEWKKIIEYMKKYEEAIKAV